jgi:hypothetical protein
MSQNENNTSSNIFMQNQTLKNMLKKISDQANNQSSNNLDLSLEKNLNNFFEDKQTEKDNNYNKNFTQEFFQERYKNFLPNNFMTPSNFLEKKDFNLNRESIKTEKNEEFSEANFTDFLFYSESFKRMNLYRLKLTLQNWIKTFNELNEEKKISIKNFSQVITHSNYSPLSLLSNFFSQFSSLTNNTVIIAEIKSIHIIDCLFIIEVMDFEFKKIQILITPKEEQGLTENILTKIEEQFKIGHIVLIRTEKMKEMKSSLNEIIYQVPTNYIKTS